MRCACVSARQIFSGACGMSRSTRTERVSVAISFMCFVPSRRCSSDLRFLLRGARRCVQRDGGADERFQRLLVDSAALVDVDGAPHIAVEAGIEEARGIVERGTLGEGQLDDALVGLAGA